MAYDGEYPIIGNAWIKINKNGEKYFSLDLREDVKAGTPMFMNKNKTKRKDSRDPDYTVSIKRENG